VGLADVLVSRALATAEHLGDRPREAGRA
jgi:hypothetical protein